MASGDTLKLVRGMFGRAITFEEAEVIARATVPVAMAAGALVFREGDRPEGLLLLARGTVEVFKGRPDGGTQTFATIEAPTVLGEMSLLLDRGHTASVRAVTDCAFHLLTRTQFERLLEGNSLAAYKLIATIAEVLAKRLARMDEKVLELSAARTAPAPVEELAQFKQKLFSEWSF